MMISRAAAAVLISGLAVFGLAGGALADEHEVCGIDLTEAVADGAITAEVTSIAFIAGVRWGSGELILNDGERRKFKIIGGKALETGVSSNVITGEVYNMKNVDDFEGTYYGASAKIAIVKGEGELVANNSNCVVIKGRAVGHGIQLSAPGPAGVEISFTDE